MSKKLKLVVSDFHVGRGRLLPNGSFNPLEDFFFDSQFLEFLRYYRTGEFSDVDVELILNGDFLNHLQVDPSEELPDVISERVALWRTEAILQGHPKLFEGLKEFASTPGHRITYLMGNHDPGLLFPKVVQRLQKAVPGLEVRLDTYRFDGIHIEHGHQFFADNAYNPDRYFLTKDLPEPIVNLPWGSYFVIHYLNKVRRDRPYFTKVYPFRYYLRWALIHDTAFALRTITRVVFYFLWLRFRKDPHRRSSLIRTLQIIKEVGIIPRPEREAKKILFTEKETRIVIFGHTHHAVVRQYAPGKIYLNTGPWNEQISLELSNPGKLVQLTFALIEYNEKGIPKASLKEWKGSHKVIEDLGFL